MAKTSFSISGEGVKRRWPAIDVARGIAIIAMALFHFTWDLGYFGIVDYDISFAPEGRLIAHGIAGSFLFLVGIGLALAHRGGLNWRSFWHRFRLVAGAALLVSVGTLIAMPEEWIFFGVLHCIALSSLLALPLLRAPAWLLASTAFIVLLAPVVVEHPFFDQPFLYWLGLNHILPRTNDYVPLFPWLGVVLAGMLAARLAAQSPWLLDKVQTPRTETPARQLARFGRFSLPIYLIHQPVMMGLIWVVLSVTGPVHLFQPADGGFAKACTASCVATGRSDAKCVSSCACVGEAIAAQSPAVSTLSEFEMNKRIDQSILICRAKGAL